MPACDYCGKIAAKLTENPNGRTQLRLCPMCQAEYELKHTDSLKPADLTAEEQPWWRTWWRKLKGQ